MDIHLLEDIGLTKSQAAAYQTLIGEGAATAPAIAAIIGEGRSNAYKILDRLCNLGLASKNQVGKKVIYYPASPAALEQLLQREAALVHLRERKLKNAMPDMLQYFFAHSEQPSIKFFQGKEGLRQIFSDMLATGQTLYLLRTPEDIRFYDREFFEEIRKKRLLMGVKTIGITPDVPEATHDPEIDFRNKFIRTWLPKADYTASVEWNVSGNKVALISYGKEAIGVVIESAQIAESVRQVLQLIAKHQTTQPQQRPAQQPLP